MTSVRHVHIRRLVIDRSVAGSAQLDREALAAAIGRALDGLGRTAPMLECRTHHPHDAGRLAALIAGGLSRRIGMARGARSYRLTGPPGMSRASDRTKTVNRATERSI